MPSPCVKICVLEGNTCKGCGRSKKQIAEWANYPPQEQLRIMKELQNEQHKIK